MSSSLKFRFATMGSGKSAEIISVVKNYDDCGLEGLKLIPRKGAKSKEEISSRNGYAIKAKIVENDENIFEFAKKEIESGKDIKYVIIDEAQFLTEEQVWQVTDIVDYLDIDVLAYGILTDSFTEFFPGSDLLMRVADSRQELPVFKLCPGCGKKSVFNSRVVNGEMIKQGEQVAIKDENDNVKYITVCRRCYKENKWKRD